MGALRAGAGLVTIATPASCQPTLAALAPEYMTEALAETAGELSEAARGPRARAAAGRHRLRPGLGRTPAVRAFVRALVERAAVPLVLDADALVAFDDAPDALAGSDERQIVITPHPGEMARLLGVSIEEVQANRLDVAGRVRHRTRRARGAEGAPHGDRDARRAVRSSTRPETPGWPPAAPATC